MLEVPRTDSLFVGLDVPLWWSGVCSFGGTAGNIGNSISVTCAEATTRGAYEYSIYLIDLVVLSLHFLRRMQLYYSRIQCAWVQTKSRTRMAQSGICHHLISEILSTHANRFELRSHLCSTLIFDEREPMTWGRHHVLMLEIKFAKREVREYTYTALVCS